jgi:putative nucleotidyltransferase with HDIG domain
MHALASTLPGQARSSKRRLDSMLEALDAKAGTSIDHVLSVRSLALSIAGELRLGRSARQAVGRGALLHDVGKLSIPDVILTKPGPLDEREWDVMRSHSAAGMQLLTPFVRDRRVLAIVRCHHERWDGAGYPDGLAGDAIPLGARIVAVADSFQAMLESRPYRRALAPDDALERIAAEGGRQFDPACVDAFGRVAPRLALGG